MSGFLAVYFKSRCVVLINPTYTIFFQSTQEQIEICHVVNVTATSMLILTSEKSLADLLN